MDVWLVIGQLIIAVLLFLIALLTWLVWPSIIGACWKPTPLRTVRKMLELAGVNEGDMVYDLGSGDGRIILMASTEFGAKACGIEADPIWVMWSRMSIRFQGVRQLVRVIWGNFFDQHFDDATVVTVYQTTDINQRLKTKFLQELKPGTRVVSHSFTFDGWTPLKTDAETGIYLYRV